MTKRIEIPNVPDDLYVRLEAEAATDGQTLSEYLLAKLGRMRTRVAAPSWKRLRLSQDDLRSAKGYAQLILRRSYHRSRPLAVPAQAVYTAFIISYSRPFSGNKDWDGTSTKWWGPLLDRLSVEDRALHHRIIEERNTLVAHTDGKRRDVRLLPSRTHAVRMELHSGVPSKIGEEQFFHSALSLIERLLADLRIEIDRLEPFERAKAEEHEHRSPPTGQ
jgi:hypothetical protein